MYRPRPTEPRARRVFDFTLDSRLRELSRYDGAAVVLICDSQSTADSFADLPTQYPHLTFLSVIANPEPIRPSSRDFYADTPSRCEWTNPPHWRHYAMTDRWARIIFALDLASRLSYPGYLIMPAHDAVWGSDLLNTLVRLSEANVKNDLPAAVSPYTPFQHSPVPGADIPQSIIDALNAAFNRDSSLRSRLKAGDYQSFWGKMGMIPFGMCGAIQQRVETIIWEDDLEIDRAIREMGYAVRAEWIDDPSIYRQALPVFERDGLRNVIERTLHYSLNIPGDTSILMRPLDHAGRLLRSISPRYAQAVALSEAVTAECRAEIDTRLQRYGQSWVDWGAYRYVVRVGDPAVQVWKYHICL
ncbi:MAG TPA: hypothetical protein VHD90_12490 [Phototrophicaceae bacterium]|nr:hypothetical protein [Phototrophicaceae bacterium]